MKDVLEKTELTIGYMPLTDSLPLLVADAHGYFQEQGLDVSLQQEVSWANIRDKVLVGHLDAAQMLAPMLIATHLGLGGIKKPMMTPFAFALNGNGFTISNQLASELDRIAGCNVMADAALAGNALKQLVEERRQQQRPVLLFATVYPYSIHNLLLRDWLSANGIDPDIDVALVVLPPSQMVDHLSQQNIDGFFAGAPWNSVAIQRGVGSCLLASNDLWHSAPDKVLGMTSAWAEAHPNVVKALVRALDKACRWIDHNRQQAASIMTRYVNVPEAAVLPALTGQFTYRTEQPPIHQPDMLVFHRYLANYPWAEHGAWFLHQLQRWNWAKTDIDAESLVRECYRADLYCEALGHHTLGEHLQQGLSFRHEQPWQLGDVPMAATAFSYQSSL
ncbi:CmpA/NrtA family ABC transporter substrate-binding protein [Parathalassolituus penaei]|uniref:CmpA/NrtA family ABC transporter substrate-binding protein n=1 Tax=Parathalassolituus penaei TaxID=2997323 RepID=A0A9X3EFF2_9GAMM|nr:CmpA/NrtA family ABC transporter substrate-binding protein [Parathalassolituus penaei]MCY0966552.1 CmpA/NrtA family ABC transporter substrate-binding protein [Parathalassolituus penaei]